MCYKHLSCLLLVLVAFFAIGTPSLAGEAACHFFAEGDLYSESTLTSPGKSPTTSATHFTLNYDNCNWQIQTERKGKDAHTGRVFELKFVVGTTNSDIFAVSYHRRNGATNWICLDGSARTGPVPYIMMDPTIQMIWVVFIAQCDFPTNGRQMLPPVFLPYNPELYDALFYMPADVKHNDNVPHFISNLTFYLDKWRYYEESQDAMVMSPLERPLPSPYEEGCTNFVYSVRKFEKSGNLTWPSSFDFVFYGMKNGASISSDLRIVGLAHGTVTTFTSHTQTIPASSFVPEIARGTLVNEERFIHDDTPVFAFDYYSSGTWQTKAEIANSPGYRKEMQKQAELKPLIKGRPHTQTPLYAGALKKQATIALLGVTLFAIVPILFLLQRNNKRK